MPESSQHLRGLIEIYPHEELLDAYIKSGSPYADVAHLYQATGTSASSILSMLVNAADRGEPFRFFQEGDYESTVAAEVEHGLDPSAFAPTGWEAAKEEARAIVAQPRKGAFGLFKGALETKLVEDYIRPVETSVIAAEAYRDYTGAMKRLGEEVTQPAVVEAKKAMAKSVRYIENLNGPVIEAWFKRQMATGKALDKSELHESLMSIAERGLLPPPDEYSEEFIQKLKNDSSCAPYLFLLSEEASKGTTKGEPDWFTDRMGAYKTGWGPLGYVPALGVAMGESAETALDRFVIEEFEHPEWWHWMALAYGGAKLGMGPGMRSAAEAAKKGKWYGKFLMWDMGKGFHNYLVRHYDTTFVRKILGGEVDVPGTALQNYLRGAGADDPFLRANPMVRFALKRMEAENPKYMQKLMNFMVENIDNLDDVVYSVVVPRKLSKLVQEAAGPLKGKRPAHQGVLEVIAKNEGDDAAGLVAALWDAGIDTMEASVTPGFVRIAISPPTQEALLELKSAPFGYMTQVIDDVTEHIAVIPRNKTAQALQYIKKMRQHAPPIQTKPPKFFHNQLDDMVNKGWIDEDELLRIKNGIIPDEIPSVPAPATKKKVYVLEKDVSDVAAPATATGAGQAASPTGDTGLAPSPAAAAGPFDGPAAALTADQKLAYKTPLHKWILKRKLPDDILKVQRHPARVKGWDLVTDKQIDDYLNRLSRVVQKYTPDRAADFQKAYTQYLSQTGHRTAGEWDKFVQWAHTEYTRAKWLPEMTALGIDDPAIAAPLAHEKLVRSALEAGKNVSDDVLKDYPALVAEFAEKTPPMTMEAMERMAMQPDAPPPAPVRQAPPPVPHTVATPVNKQSGRKLGWTDPQLKRMTPEEVGKIIAEGLTPDKYKITPKGTVKPITPPAGPAVTASDLAPRPNAIGLIKLLDDDTMRMLHTARMDRRADPADILRIVGENNPAFAARFNEFSKDLDPGTLLDTILNVWKETATGASYFDDMIAAKSAEQWKSYPGSVKQRLINLRDKHKFKSPEMLDPELGAHYAAGADRANSWIKQQIGVMKASTQAQVTEFDIDKTLRTMHTQFWDDMRTGYQPIPARALMQANTEMGIIFGHLNNNQRQHAFKILGLRNDLSNLVDDIELPGPWTKEALFAELDRQTAAAGPAVLKSVDTYYDIMRLVGEDLVRRGKIPPAALRDNYLPEYVLKYTPDEMFKASHRPSLRGKMQQQYRGYTKKRVGGTDEIALSPQAIRLHLAELHADNMMDDWILSHLEAEDLWNAVAKPGMTDDAIKEVRGAVFGVNETTGKTILPRHGKRYDIPGIDEPFYGFQFVPGNRYYVTEGVNRSALGHAIEDSLLLPADAAEQLASQIDLYSLAKGEIPEALAKLIDEAGPMGGSVTRRIIAVAGRNRAYVVPESIYKNMMFYGSQDTMHIPGLYGFQHFTTMWKRLTLGWAGLPFQWGNLQGDMLNAFRTAPGSLKHTSAALRILYNLNRPLSKQGRGPFGKMTAADRETLEIALKYSGFDAGFAGEVFSYKDIMNPTRFWHRIEQLSAYREMVPRLAMLKYQLQYFDKHSRWHAPEFAHILYDKLGKPRLTREAGSSFIMRNFTVDYEALPGWYNQMVRGTSLPFATFWQKNAEYWTRYAVADPKGFAAKFIMPRVLAHSWNTQMYPDVEAAMGGLARRGHLTLFKWDSNDDGTDDYAMVMAPQLPPDMAAQVWGFDRLEEKITAIQQRRFTGTLEEAIEDAAKQQLIDMGLGTPRMLDKLAHPMIQCVRGRLDNKHPFTKQPILTKNQLDLSPWQRAKYWRKFYFGQMISPFGQYMMDQSNQNVDTLAALGIYPKNPLARYVLRGPLNPLRGPGIFVIDLKRGEQQAQYQSRRKAEERAAYTEEKIYEAYYEFEGKPHEYMEFFAQPNVKTILEDAAMLKQDFNLEYVQQMLANPSIQIMYWKSKAHRAKTRKEYMDCMMNVRVLSGVKSLKAVRGTPTPARPGLVEELRKRR